MTLTLEKLGIERLAPHEKMELAQVLWDRAIEELENSPISEEVKAMLDARIADSVAKPGTGILWEVIEQETLAKLSAHRARESA